MLDAAARVIKPGVTTDNIDEVVHQATISAGAYPSPLNYYFIPKPCCTFVHEVICHGIPDARQLEEGDIVNVDVTVCLNGCHAELNETYILAKWMKHQKLWQCSSSLDVLCKISFLEDLELTCKPKDCTGFFNSLESQESLLDDTVVSHAMEQTLGRFPLIESV
ncbi:unnamed protein product [Sphagnum jensenii]|uniref:Peptidase M24 domain-containing protein n=1 Tax=Sphagnum jensenii TaxID=128206 RepID=A0ABP0XCT1_9BRYO